MPELVDRPQPVANGRDIHSPGHADDSRVRVRPDAPDVQIGDPGVARPLDEFADLGLDEDQVGYIIDNDEDWPSDMLLRIAGELGFGDELEDFIDGLDSDDS